ncbi:MAG TPA: PhzF family phenazine biosynthesis protein [Candidatus Binatia bacterium]|nr:PhzF family phenazine biosynthesis protein [Candidatus Binatia bacterium]
MSSPSLFLVDVFAERPYAGNQLAVVIGADGWATERMQAFAQEMNFSETTFVASTTPRDGGYDVRIFTPAEELPFAGHPTLGTAWVLRNFVIGSAAGSVTLNLRVGAIAVSFEGDDGSGRCWLRPRPPVLGPVRNVLEIASVLGLPLQAIDQRFVCQDVAVGVEFVLVPLRSLEALRSLRPPSIPATLSGKGTGVLAFCAGGYDEGGEIAARMFFDARGIREDPATGSANACLAAYVSEHRFLGGDVVEARVQQGYEIDRPSTLYLRAASPQEVQVGGKVVLVARGEVA